MSAASLRVVEGLGDPSAASSDGALLVVRVLVGVVLAMHGGQKLWGYFGGGGLKATASWFSALGFRHGRLAAYMAGGTEVLAGLGLAVGLLTPLAATAMIGVMTVAAIVNRADGGFWSVRKGWELNGYLIVIAWLIAALGPGRWSLDHALGLERGGMILAMIVLLAGVGAGVLRWQTRGGNATRSS